MSFYAEIQANMRAEIYNADNDMSELIEYWPKGVEANKREIYAVIERQPSTQNGSTPRPAYRVHVLNSSTYGVSSDELDTGKDLFKFAERKGKTATERNVKRIDDNDEAEILLVF
jgi:hypothetical protein